jgi:hypothetical protein
MGLKETGRMSRNYAHNVYRFHRLVLSGWLITMHPRCLDMYLPSTYGEKYCMNVAYRGMVPRKDDKFFDNIRPKEQVYVTLNEELCKHKISQDICKSVRTHTEEWLFDTGLTVHITPC